MRSTLKIRKRKETVVDVTLTEKEASLLRSYLIYAGEYGADWEQAFSKAQVREVIGLIEALIDILPDEDEEEGS